MALRWKLALLTALVVAVAVLASGAALVAGLERSLTQALDQELDARARAVVALVEHEHGRWFVESKSGLDDEFAESRGAYYVVAFEGKTVLASALARKLGVVPADDGRRDVPALGRRYRELTATLEKLRDEEEGGGKLRLRVVVGKDAAAVDQAVLSLVGQLRLVGPVVLALALAAGLFLASRALAPLERMTRAAEAIGAEDLSRRLAVPGQDEVARLGRTLDQAFARLEAAFEERARFTADASHELRTPLAAIAGNVELAQKRARDPAELREAIQDIGESAERMQNVVEGLLTLARADAGALVFRREPVALADVARDVVQHTRPLAEKHGVTVAVHPDGDVRALGDPDRLRELVSNLVTNAIRYNVPAGRVDVRVATEAGRARLAVEDTGIGIPAPDLPHVFERFYRVDKARTRDAGGSGLGLAIAKAIADRHQGTIEVTSEPGKGSRFVVSLPAAAAIQKNT